MKTVRAAVFASPPTIGRGSASALGLLFLGALAVSCSDDSSKDAPDAATGKQIVEPNPSLDTTTTLRRGPWLNAPSAGTVTVSWSTTEASSSRVELTPEGGQAQVVEGIVFLPVPTTPDPVVAGTIPTDYQHEVVLDGLVPGQSYTYRILSAADPKPQGTFTGPPERGDDFSFFLFGDTRSNHADHTDVITSMVALVEREGPVAFVVHTGDMVSTGGTIGHWDTFFEIEAPLISRSPILPVFGNHEAFLGRTVYESLFAIPPSSTSPSVRWYSVDMGDIHIATIDPYAMEMEPHLDWLEEDLASSTAKFKILAVHAPLFTFSNHPPAFALRDALLPILQASDVHLVVSGHNHLYERFFGHGIHFVVSGGGGAPLYGADDNPEADNSGAARLVADESMHYVFGRLTGDSIRFEAHTVPDETLIDCWVIDAFQPGAELPCVD